MVSPKLVPTTVAHTPRQTASERGSISYPIYSTVSAQTAQVRPTRVLPAISQYSIQSSFTDTPLSASITKPVESTSPAVTTVPSVKHGYVFSSHISVQTTTSLHQTTGYVASSVVTRKTVSKSQKSSFVSLPSRTHSEMLVLMSHTLGANINLDVPTTSSFVIQSNVLTSLSVFPGGSSWTSSSVLFQQHSSKNVNQIPASSYIYEHRVSVTSTYKASADGSTNRSNSTNQGHSATSQNFYVEIIFPLNFDEVANDTSNFNEALINYLIALLGIDRYWESNVNTVDRMYFIQLVQDKNYKAASFSWKHCSFIHYCFPNQPNWCYLNRYVPLCFHPLIKKEILVDPSKTMSVISVAISSKDVSSMIQSSVLGGRFTFTFKGINFTASNARQDTTWYKQHWWTKLMIIALFR